MTHRLLLALAVIVVTTSAAVSQVFRDQQSIVLLTGVINTSGTETLIKTIQDFSATGTITYFWAGNAVQGTVLLRSRGLEQFRLDATLPKGVRSWLINNGSGAIKEFDGSITELPLHNVIRLGALTFPAIRVEAALMDSSIAISSPVAAQLDQKQLYDISIDQPLNPKGRLKEFGKVHINVDAKTFWIVSVRDTLGSLESSDQRFDHVVEFGDYRTVNGVQLPFQINESISGQRVWSIQLSDVTFNKGLTDSDFSF